MGDRDGEDAEDGDVNARGGKSGTEEKMRQGWKVRGAAP